MSVMAVAFHPSRPFIASAGADSLTKVFTTTNTSGANNANYAIPTQSPTSTSAVNTTTTSPVSSSTTITSGAILPLKHDV